MDILRNHKNSLGVLILFVIAMLFFSPLLFGDKVIFYRDFTFVTFPFRYFLAHTFQAGSIPYWNTNAYAGMPFMAGFHPGVFYPPSTIFFIENTPYALNLFYVFHFLVLGSFSFLLARCWGLSFMPALCSGITGMLSGFIVASTLLSNFFLAAVWLPMIFWMFHRYWVQKHIGYFMGLVAAIAIQTLAACPEVNIMTMVLLYVHSLCFLQRKPGFAGFTRLTVSLGAAVVLALGLSSLQLIPTAKLLDHSFRDEGLSYETHTRWSLEPSKLSTLVLSPDYGKLLDSRDYPAWFNGFIHTLYMGLLGLAFVLCGFIFRREKPIGFWLVVFLLGIFLAFGKYNPLYEIFYPWIPLLNIFRFPEKYFFVSSFAAVFLSGYVLEALIQRSKNRRSEILSVITILILLFGVTLNIGMRQTYPSPLLPILIVLLFGFAFVMFRYRKLSKSVFASIVCLLVLIDLGVKDIQLLPVIDRKFYEEKPLIMDIVGDSFGKYRVYSGQLAKTPNPNINPPASTWMNELLLAKQYLRPFTGMVYRVEHAGGHPGLGLELNKHLVWFQALIKASPDKRMRILKRSNVKYWVDWDSTTRSTAQGAPLILPDRVKIWNDALPRAYLVGRMQLGQKSEILNTYYDESFDPLASVLLSNPVDFAPSTQFSGKVEEVVYRPNHVTVKTFQEGDGFLVLMDSYFPGWTVTVDGREQLILQANHFYRAVQLDSGPHTLEFDYFPEGYKEGLVVSAIALLILMVLPLWNRWWTLWDRKGYRLAQSPLPGSDS